MVLSQNLNAQESNSKLKDPKDNAFDLSHYLLNLHGLLPVISPITEPAIGYGATLALSYFIPKKPDKSKKFQMPDMVFGAGAYTENKTWFGGAGYLGFWNDDHLRYRGIVGYANVNLKYYGNNNPVLDKYPIKFSLKSYMILQQFNWRIKNSGFFIGVKYMFASTKTVLFEDSDISWIKPIDFEINKSGLSLLLDYEKLDNYFSPTKGIRVHLDYEQNLKVIGSDRDFGTLTFYTHYYQPIGKFWVPAFRFESLLATGTTPFYGYPYINLRGVPAMRYQGKLSMLIETEQLFNLNPRWGVVAFLGTGNTVNNFEEFDFGTQVWNAGAGFRYLIARLLGLKMGVDIARSNEDWAFYVIFGSSWSK